jgi:hypothetical protein
MNRVAQFENIAMQSQRPITPPNQNVSSKSKQQVAPGNY